MATSISLNVQRLVSIKCICGAGNDAAIHDDISHVEPESVKDSRQWLIDFGKLVAGSGEMKLFIGPIVHDRDYFLRVLQEPARHCGGDVYLAMVPHPDSWEASSAEDIKLWMFGDGEWLVLNR
ncbi:MAG: hypothetical protein PVI78_13450 [Anaerolineales bacterium]